MLVLDHERLYNDLQRDLPSTTHIVPLPKSGGVGLTLYAYMLHVGNFISRLCCAPIQFQDWFTRCICEILESMQIPYFHRSSTQFAWKAHTMCMYSVDLSLPSHFNCFHFAYQHLQFCYFQTAFFTLLVCSVSRLGFIYLHSKILDLSTRSHFPSLHHDLQLLGSPLPA